MYRTKVSMVISLISPNRERLISETTARYWFAAYGQLPRRTFGWLAPDYRAEIVYQELLSILWGQVSLSIDPIVLA